MTLTDISAILNSRLEKTGLQPKIQAALVCDKFNQLTMEIWGPKVENQIRAMYVKDKILTVACLSSVLANEVRLKESRLSKMVNEHFGQPIVDRIRILA